MTDVAGAFVDALIEDGYLLKAEELLRAFKSPAGRSPSAETAAVAESASKLDEQDAVRLIRATLDAATFGFLSLLDADFKNSGLHASLWIGDSCLDTANANGRFHEAYRERIDPNGMAAEVRSA